MLSLVELEAVKATLLRLAGENVGGIANHLAALNWAIQAETDIAEIKSAGGFKSPEAYGRIRDQHQRRDSAKAQ